MIIKPLKSLLAPAAICAILAQPIHAQSSRGKDRFEFHNASLKLILDSLASFYGVTVSNDQHVVGVVWNTDILMKWMGLDHQCYLISHMQEGHARVRFIGGVIYVDSLTFPDSAEPARKLADYEVALENADLRKVITIIDSSYDVVICNPNKLRGILLNTTIYVGKSLNRLCEYLNDLEDGTVFLHYQKGVLYVSNIEPPDDFVPNPPDWPCMVPRMNPGFD